MNPKPALLEITFGVPIGTTRKMTAKQRQAWMTQQLSTPKKVAQAPEPKADQKPPSSTQEETVIPVLEIHHPEDKDLEHVVKYLWILLKEKTPEEFLCSEAHHAAAKGTNKHDYWRSAFLMERDLAILVSTVDKQVTLKQFHTITRARDQLAASMKRCGRELDYKGGPWSLKWSQENENLKKEGKEARQPQLDPKLIGLQRLLYHLHCFFGPYQPMDISNSILQEDQRCLLTNSARTQDLVAVLLDFQSRPTLDPSDVQICAYQLLEKHSQTSLLLLEIIAANPASPPPSGLILQAQVEKKEEEKKEEKEKLPAEEDLLTRAVKSLGEDPDTEWIPMQEQASVAPEDEVWEKDGLVSRYPTDKQWKAIKAEAEADLLKKTES
jgi:hypothetical protein